MVLTPEKPRYSNGLRFIHRHLGGPYEILDFVGYERTW